MKISRYTIALAVAGLMGTANTFAQTGVYQPLSVQHPTNIYGSYYAAQDEPASPSDVPLPQAAANGAACDICCEEEACNPCGEPWTLQGWLQPCGNERGIEFGGWLSGGARWNDQGNRTSTGNAPAGGFTNDAAVFNLHQAWFYAERGIDLESNCGWDFGGRFDFVFGADGPDTQAFGDVGYDNSWDSGGEYGSALPQLYLDVAYNDILVRAGHFYTNIGYEVVQAPSNFFYTHSYQQYYAEPFTHTGAYATQQYNDNWAWTAGYVQGWDSGFNHANDGDMFLGGLRWTSTDEATIVGYAVNAGNFGNGTAGVGNQGDLYLHTVHFQRDMGQGRTFVLHHDYAVNNDLPGGSNEWYGLAAYFLKEWNCCWSGGVRLEWFRDVDGVRVPGANDGGDFYEATVGVNWKPNANLTFRPEVRYDWFGGNATPFDDGSQDNLLTAGFDVIWTF